MNRAASPAAAAAVFGPDARSRNSGISALARATHGGIVLRTGPANETASGLPLCPAIAVFLTRPVDLAYAGPTLPVYRLITNDQGVRLTCLLPHCLHNTSQNKKKPGAKRPPGGCCMLRGQVPARYSMTFPPIKRLSPSPGVLRFKQPVPGADKIVGDNRLSVVSETIEHHPFRRARASRAHINRS